MMILCLELCILHPYPFRMGKENPVELAIIDYGMGNLRSVAKAFEHVDAEVKIITESSQLGNADALVLPGVGAVGDCMAGLRAGKMDDLVKGWIQDDRPFLGVCLGLQALFEHSTEGDVDCLGIFPGKVEAFDLSREFKVPHMGWNEVRFLRESKLSEGIAEAGEQFYFVHSYYVKPENTDIIWCETDYGGAFTSGIQSGNCFAAQFHPEKSQARGLQMYSNFVQWVASLRASQ